MCLALSLTAAPLNGPLAEDGFMVMQFDFALGNKPGFRQINLVYEDDVGRTEDLRPGPTANPGIVIPLYSMNPRTPGIFNRLDSEQSADDDEPEGGIRAALTALLGVGVIALYAYATAECIEDISNAVQNSAACEAL